MEIYDLFIHGQLQFHPEALTVVMNVTVEKVQF